MNVPRLPDGPKIDFNGWVAIAGIFMAGLTAFYNVKSDVAVQAEALTEIRATQLATTSKIDTLYNLALTHNGVASNGRSETP